MRNSSDQEIQSSRAGGASRQNATETWYAIGYESETDTYHVSFDGTESISMAIISSMATISDTDSLNSAPLYATVDPDALNDLVSTANGSDLQITFTYNGYRIEVDGGGHIAMTEVDD